MICPKCQFQQTESDTCIHCGVIFQKYLEYLQRVEEKNRASSENATELEKDSDEGIETPSRFFSILEQDWKPAATPAFLFISALFLFHIILFPKEPELKDWSLLSSLIHNVNLVFHEAGHALFGLFGNRTLTILGGSLNQLLIPFIVLLAFISKRDTSGTAFASIWFFGNFLDVGIYMADARFLKLPLIGGLGMEAHDWRNLFNQFDLWSVDQLISHATFYTGWVGIIFTWIWLFKKWCSQTQSNS